MRSGKIGSAMQGSPRARAATYYDIDISAPTLQHGTYSFYFWDADENVWEILTNPEGGYDWLYCIGDQTGRDITTVASNARRERLSQLAKPVE